MTTPTPTPAPAPTDPPPKAGPRLTEQAFRAIVIGGGVVWFILLFAVGFTHDLSVPKRPPRPPEPDVKSATKFSDDVDRSPDAWAKYLSMDARAFGLGAVEPAELTQVLPRQVDEDTHILSADEGSNELVSSGLRLRFVVRDVGGTPTRLMALQVENMTDGALAYRIDTMPSNGTQGCKLADKMSFNAIAVEPHGIEMRYECVYRTDGSVKIKRIETLGLAPLSYHYVSRLDPAQIGIEKRHAKGHNVPREKRCSLIFPAAVHNALKANPTGVWRDMIDFYARHRCDSYVFPVGYKAFEQDGQVALPAPGSVR